eukprot:CAMPEP_0206303018 /NCGR_PEP_ID=MMETSP0106_2-20121207/9021_1 /ASSEMBLY_ACC=CAM_ASM_000206 /TAXON_ID=81532 /ORGANISM="Acanthoeca-like sp., Strain 10tr" /LENGTH=947 /DNA_ID=CAMNT_0053733801 /DNA_START=45 /DNA_END=2888 /DNA_ORIENTATION=+
MAVSPTNQEYLNLLDGNAPAAIEEVPSPQPQPGDIDAPPTAPGPPPPKYEVPRSRPSSSRRSRRSRDDNMKRPTLTKAELAMAEQPAGPRRLSSMVKNDQAGSPSIWMVVQNGILSRGIRRKTLSAAIQNVEWSKAVGGGSSAQKLRLKERIILFRVLHLIFTFAVWQHFFYNKFRAREKAVKEGAPNYRWKRIVPPVEFGLMHAVLFQLMLIPLTVSRSLLAWIATKTSILPLEHIMTLHIHIGYAFCIIMVGSAALFFTFFGKLCQEHKDGTEPVDMCAKFRTEIMCTGYVILGVTIIIMITSYFRGRLKFEWFYTTHIIAVAVMYCGALIHTLDDEFRKGSKIGKARSQTFRWLIGSLTLFLADRAWRYITQETEVVVISSHCHADGGSVTLNLLKPWWFTFVPGQYIHLQIPMFDAVWHPFSIGSSPNSNVITVIIEVVRTEGEWTDRLARAVQEGKLVSVNLRGPFGNPVGPPPNSPSSANIIAIGSGTGIMPMVSLLKHRAEALGHLSVAGLARTEETLAERQMHANMAWCLGHNVTPKTNEGIRHFQLLYRKHRFDAFLAGKKPMPAFVKAGAQETPSDGSVFAIAFVMLWACLETATTSLMLSWSNLQSPATKTPGMTGFLELTSILLVLPYAAVVAMWIFCRSRAEQGPTLYVHVLAVVAMSGILLAFIVYDKFDALTPVEQAALVFLSVWRTASAWSFRRPRSSHGLASSNPVESFRLLWTTRSADLAIGVLQDLERTFLELENKMHGYGSSVVCTRAFSHLQMHVWCTDTNPHNIAELKRWIKGTRYESVVSFERPNFGTELVVSMRRHIMAPSFMNRLPGEKKTCAVTFCGSPAVSDAVFHAVQRCGQLARVAGASDFQYTFRTESYSNMPKPRQGTAGRSWSKHVHDDRKQLKIEEWNRMRERLSKPSVRYPASLRSRVPAGGGQTDLEGISEV